MADGVEQNVGLTPDHLITLGQLLNARAQKRTEALATIQKESEDDAKLLAGIARALRPLLDPDGGGPFLPESLLPVGLPAATEILPEEVALQQRLYAAYPPIEVLFEHTPQRWEVIDNRPHITIAALQRLLARVDGKPINYSQARLAMTGWFVAWEAKRHPQTFRSPRQGRARLIEKTDALRFLDDIATHPQSRRTRKAYILRQELSPDEEAARNVKKN